MVISQAAYLLSWLALSAALPSPDTARAQSDPTSELKSELRESLGKLSGKSDHLDDQYLEALKALLGKLEDSFDSTGSKVVRQEIDDFRREGPRAFSEYPPLEKLRRIYDQSRERIESETIESRIALLKIYRERSRLLQESLAGEDKNEAAVRAGLLADEIEKCIADPEDLSSLLALWRMTTVQDIVNGGEAILERKRGRFLISSKRKAGSRVITNVDFGPPFEISTRIATDSVNIRYYIGPRVIAIFNWELKPTQLRLHDPRGGVAPTPIDDKGYVAVHEMHEIRIKFYRDRFEVYADGEFRGMLTGDFSKIRGKPGVGPAFGSTLSVERFEILPLKERRRIPGSDAPDRGFAD